MKIIIFSLALLAMWTTLLDVNEASITVKHTHSKLMSLIKRGHDDEMEFEKRDEPNRGAPGYFDSGSCPFGFHCMEVSSPKMWLSRGSPDHCSPGGEYTCAYKDGATASAWCKDFDQSSATVTLKHGDSSIVYSADNANIYGTFGDPTNSEIKSTKAEWAAAYVGCKNR